MTTAKDVTDEIGEECVVDQRRALYWVPGVTDVSAYSDVGSLSPIPDPIETDAW